jgi:hypothetical protein
MPHVLHLAARFQAVSGCAAGVDCLCGSALSAPACILACPLTALGRRVTPSTRIRRTYASAAVSTGEAFYKNARTFVPSGLDPYVVTFEDKAAALSAPYVSLATDKAAEALAFADNRVRPLHDTPRLHAAPCMQGSQRPAAFHSCTGRPRSCSVSCMVAHGVLGVAAPTQVRVPGARQLAACRGARPPLPLSLCFVPSHGLA